MDIDFKKKKILVIDDDQPMIDITTGVLSRYNAMPQGANSPLKGLELAVEDEFDAIVLDRKMPEMDGNEVLKKLKSNEKTKNIPVIMLTGVKDQKEIKESLDLGADGYVLKPFQPRNLLQQLGRTMGLIEANFFIDVKEG